MKQITQHLRRAFVSMLSGIEYLGDTIPVRDSMIQSGVGRITIAPGFEADAYILLTNMTRSDNQTKNAQSTRATITVDIVTAFHGRSYNIAGNEWVEELSDLVLDRLFDEHVFKLREFGTTAYRFVISDVTHFNTPMPLQYNDQNRIFRNVTVYEMGIQTIPGIYPGPFWIKTVDGTFTRVVNTQPASADKPLLINTGF